MGDNFLKKKAAGLLDCKVEKAEVTDGRGLFAGVRGFIHISKENLGKVTKEEYTEFVTGTVETGSYRWFTILCGDGTGIQFVRPGRAVYGRVNGEGVVTDIACFITLDGEGSITRLESEI